MSLQDLQTRPTLLVVDSGVGGLSIYQPLWQRWPALHYLYAFDNAGFPYGDLSANEVSRRLIALIAAVQQRQRFHLVVVACNTASTAALPLLRQRFSVPIVGVVPAIKPAAAITRNGVIGLLATPATIQRPYIDELIQQFAAHCQVERLGSIELVRLAEAKLRGQAISTVVIEKILAPWLCRSQVPDTIVLGCTHFPLLSAELLKVLSPEVVLIDSATAVARQVEKLLLPYCNDQQQALRNKIDDRSRQVNQAYCTRLDASTAALQGVLQHYQLMRLQAIPLDG